MSHPRWIATTLLAILVVACGGPADDATDLEPSPEAPDGAGVEDDTDPQDVGDGDGGQLREEESDEAAALASVAPLLRADGWRDDLDVDGWPYHYLEVAFDEPTAQQAWDEFAPDELTDRNGDPDQPGRYGSLEDVDFDRQLVVIWSSGDPASCTRWLADVGTNEDGLLELREEEVGDSCEDEGYHHHRMLLAVDRDRLPDPKDLPTMWVDGVPQTLASSYPASEALADASARAEELVSEPILDADGELAVPVDRIQDSVLDYTSGPPDTSIELAEVADAAVVARATDREQTELGDVGGFSDVTTFQSFEIVDTWWGDLDDEVTVAFFGGITAEGGEVVLVEGDDFPQFRHDREYLLFLYEPGHEADYVWVRGQAEGRYLIEDDTVTEDGTLDLQSPHVREKPPSDLVESIVGRDLDDLRQDLLARRP